MIGTSGWLLIAGAVLVGAGVGPLMILWGGPAHREHPVMFFSSTTVLTLGLMCFLAAAIVP